MTETVAKPKIKPNERQQQAIDILKGQVMLLAGPGTGKTFTVINRIEKMLADGVEPSSILCLTFSDAAATEMKQRLIKKMGVVASSVDIYTYHSFCNDVIKAYPAQFSLGVGVRLITDTEKIAIMKECIDEADLKVFVPERADKYFHAKNFISYVERLKTQRLSKEEYLDCINSNPSLMPRIKELEAEIYEREQNGEMRNKGRYTEIEKIKTNIEKAKELWVLYDLYTLKMINKNLIDFSDMINFVLTAFEEDVSFRKEVSNKYKYFLVDEYQDTNDLQNQIIFNLLEGNDEKNIFVVGDDDQIIYGFQGAKADNIENFLTRFPDTKVICLQENNRSTQSILDFSYEVISQDETRLENNEKFKSKNILKKLVAKFLKIIEKDKPIRRYQFGETLQEFNFIVEDIENLINSDNCPVNSDGEKDLSQVAIIAKKRSELQAFAEMLKGKNIAYQIDEGKSIFSIRSTILIYFYLKALNNHILSSDKLFGLMLSEPFKLDLEDYNKILHEKQLLKREKPNDFISIMQRLDGWQNPQKVDEFLETFAYLQEYSTVNSLRNTIVEIVNRAGILEYFYKTESNRTENLMGIKKIISEATDFSNIDKTKGLTDFIEYLDDCLLNEIDINLEKNTIIQNAVQLTTYHGSKGREFEHVYLPNLTSKNWEAFRMPGEYKLISDEYFTKEEEDLRKDSELLKLLFVGITRAKHTLTLSFADMCDGKPLQVTKYLEKFANYNFEAKQFTYSEDDFTKEFFKNISREVYDNQKAFREEIIQRVNKVVLSPSRLNDYLECPRKFFYVKVLGIDVEEADWDAANYGSVIHELLENSIKTAKQTGSYPALDIVKASFYKGLDSKRFTSEAMKDKYVKLGEKTLESFYPYFVEFPVDFVEDIEYSFDGVAVGDDLITGKIDRIERLPDGTYVLLDYKTGNPVSEKQVGVGGTKEGYFNQLCFYKYAFEKLTGKKVSQVGLMYVENHGKNVYKTLVKEDIDRIENLIKETYAKIKALEFTPTKASEEKCKFCAYKQLCKLDVI
ncbi:MAG: ATP-dependent helicase [Candidatus Gastranaerophilales bacterium]|nr:ATP-dependent helicase [Candidatus Gastranaerophilales bacterium]